MWVERHSPLYVLAPTWLRVGYLHCLIIQTIRRDPSGAVWTDGAFEVSRPDRSGADQIDAERQATDLAVGGSNPSRRAPKPQVNGLGLFAS